MTQLIGSSGTPAVELAVDPTSSRVELLDRWDAVLAAVAGTLTLWLYSFSVTPGLLSGDGGELQTLTYLLGNTHPTGYPVYLVLARLFALLPVGDLAYRVNLFSAVMGAVAVVGLYLCGRLLTEQRAISLVVALALAVGPTFWSQALIAEVYTAGAAFIVFVLLALLYWDVTSNNRVLFAAGVLGGLSLGVHMSVALLAPAVLIFLALHWRRGRAMWMAAASGALVGMVLAVGLFTLMEWRNSPAGYFNSVMQPSRSAWGMAAEDIDGPVERLLYGWQAQQFRFLMFADVIKVMPRQAADYWDGLRDEFSLILITLTIFGGVFLALRRPKVAALLLVALAIQLFTFLNYEIWDLYVFFIPSYVILALLAGAGLGMVAEGIERVLRQWLPGQRLSLAVDVVLAALLVGLAVWPAIQTHQAALAVGENPFEFDEYPVYEESLATIAAATVAGLPADAIVLTDWGMMWPYYYEAHVVGDRPDLMFLESIPADDQDELAESLLTFIDQNLYDHPIFVEERFDALEKGGGLSLIPLRVGPTMMFEITRTK